MIPFSGDRLTGERSVPRECPVLDGDICGYEADYQCASCLEHFCDKHIIAKETLHQPRNSSEFTSVTYICHECEGVRAV